MSGTLFPDTSSCFLSAGVFLQEAIVTGCGGHSGCSGSARLGWGLDDLVFDLFLFTCQRGLNKETPVYAPHDLLVINYC